MSDIIKGYVVETLGVPYRIFFNRDHMLDFVHEQTRLGLKPLFNDAEFHPDNMFLATLLKVGS